jgi:uncharacterized protein (DUF433 family)
MTATTEQTTAGTRLLALIAGEQSLLRLDEHGVIKVSGTRVTLDSIVETFQQGSTPDEIAESFPTVPLEDIYTIIGYHLRHWYAVQAYLREQDIEAEQIRLQIEEISPSVGLKERLRERRRTTKITR